MVGAFRDGIGVFEGECDIGGRSIRVRFLWSRGEVPRWEQAFSRDAGITWETNWTMEFRRHAG